MISKILVIFFVAYACNNKVSTSHSKLVDQKDELMVSVSFLMKHLLDSMCVKVVNYLILSVLY